MSAKLIGLIVLLVFLVVFAIQNTQPVDIRFLFWLFSTSVVFSILVSFFIGILVGWLICVVKKKKG
jgi:lipopolysaccharide assembly protein A